MEWQPSLTLPARKIFFSQTKAARESSEIAVKTGKNGRSGMLQPAVLSRFENFPFALSVPLW
jgi:hypothetical protein